MGGTAVADLFPATCGIARLNTNRVPADMTNYLSLSWNKPLYYVEHEGVVESVAEHRPMVSASFVEAFTLTPEVCPVSVRHSRGSAGKSIRVTASPKRFYSLPRI